MESTRLNSIHSNYDIIYPIGNAKEKSKRYIKEYLGIHITMFLEILVLLLRISDREVIDEDTV